MAYGRRGRRLVAETGRLGGFRRILRRFKDQRRRASGQSPLVALPAPGCTPRSSAPCRAGLPMLGASVDALAPRLIALASEASQRGKMFAAALLAASGVLLPMC